MSLFRPSVKRVYYKFHRIDKLIFVAVNGECLIQNSCTGAVMQTYQFTSCGMYQCTSESIAIRARIHSGSYHTEND